MDNQCFNSGPGHLGHYRGCMVAKEMQKQVGIIEIRRQILQIKQGKESCSQAIQGNKDTKKHST